jgi:hypothetical protein
MSRERTDSLASARKGGKISFLPNKATKCHVFNNGFAGEPLRTDASSASCCLNRLGPGSAL